jgi:hypothetical protein
MSPSRRSAAAFSPISAKIQVAPTKNVAVALRLGNLPLLGAVEGGVQIVTGAIE